MDKPSLSACLLSLAIAFDAGAAEPVLRSDDERLIRTREVRTGSNFMAHVRRTSSQLREQQAAGAETAQGRNIPDRLQRQ